MPLRICSSPDPISLRQSLARRATPHVPETEIQVRAILQAVQTEGDEALARYTAQFDWPEATTHDIRVPEDDIAAAHIPEADVQAIAEAAARIRAFHERQRRTSWFTHSPDAILGQMVLPVERAGLYVPGGKGGDTPLISSLLMTAIPAQVAGVGQIAVATPPRPDGSVNPYLLATARMLGITEIYRMGSAWAVAALAFGTPTVAPVDVIVGPGNIYVTMAKSLVSGMVGIDMLAGPSEITIIADASAHPRILAADMLSQAEHDTLASAVLITPDPNLAQAVREEIEQQLAALPRADLARQALKDWGIVAVVADLKAAIDLANALAPEHLELCVADPWALLPQVRHAGAVFLGHSTPEPMGDYLAGPNHVLPTMGTARFASALSVDTFCKTTSVIATTPAYLARHGATVARLARLEGLEAHARSVEARMEGKV
jgi:histidinol dehydrogenase